MIRYLFASAITILLLTNIAFSQSLFLGKKTMVFLNNKDTTKFLDLKKLVTDNDGHIVHCFPPKIFQGYITEKAKAELQKTGLPVRFVTDRIDPNTEGLTKKDQFIVNSWNKWYAKSMATRGDDKDGDKDKPALKPGRNETSEYMIGSVSVGIVFVESDGTSDPNSENWTQEDKEDVFHQIQKGLEWWTERGGYRASLSWTYDFKTVKTKYEPIIHSSEDAENWIKDVSLKLGHGTGNFHDINRNYANALRDKNRTDWAFVIYVINATNDEDGDWKGGGSVAWANLGGPLMVITNRCDGWGYTRVWEVVAHETGHIFNALDEYKGASNGNERHGLLKVINGNAEEGGIVKKNCIMKANGAVLCEYTAGQVGWVDDNFDGVFEVDYLNISRNFNLKLAKAEAEKLKAMGYNYRIDYINPLEEKNKKFYTEDFTRNTRGWPEDANTTIKNGYYNLDGNSPMPVWLPDVYNDFSMTVQAKWTGGVESAGYSIDIVSSPSGKVYSLALTGDGYEAHNTAQSGVEFTRNYLPHKSIKIKEWNTIKIECIKDKISYYINNQLITSYKDDKAADRSISLYVDQNTKVSFDNIIISK